MTGIKLRCFLVLVARFAVGSHSSNHRTPPFLIASTGIFAAFRDVEANDGKFCVVFIFL